MSSLAHLSSNALTSVFCTSTKMAAEASTADSSSTARTVMNRLPPAPPCASGISIPMRPSSKNLGIRVGSSCAACSIACTRGRTSLSAKSRTAAWNIRSSSESWVSGFTPSCRTGPAPASPVFRQATRARQWPRKACRRPCCSDRRPSPSASRCSGWRSGTARGRRFRFGVEDLGLLVAFCGVDLRLPNTLGGQNARLPLGIGGDDGRAPLALGAHLLLHGVTDVARGIDVLELYAADLGTPLVRRLVENGAQLGVDRVARRQDVIELHLADYVAERGLRQLLDRVGEIGDLIRRAHRIGDLRVNQRVDFDDDVVFRDHVLAGEDVHRLAQVDALGAEAARVAVARRRDDRLMPVHGAGTVDHGQDEVDS